MNGDEKRFNFEFATYRVIRSQNIELERAYVNQLPQTMRPRMLGVKLCERCGDKVPIWDNPKINHTWCLACRNSLAISTRHMLCYLL